jgi:hypothetical protein
VLPHHHIHTHRRIGALLLCLLSQSRSGR